MGVTVHDAVIGAMTISQVESSGYSSGATVSMGHASANILADTLYLDKAEPSASITSTDLYTILDGIDISYGLCLSSTTISLPFAKQGCAGALGAGNHAVLAATTGFAVVQSITGSTDGKSANAVVECCLLSTNGTTIPFTLSSNGNLTSAAFVDEYRMAKVTVGGSAVTGLTQVTINPGCAYSKRSTDGGVYPTHTYLDRTNPTVDLTFENEAAAQSFGPLFGDLTAMVVYFAKKADGGSRVADATAEHVAISCGDAMSIVDSYRGQGRNPAEITIKVSAKQLAVNLASAIP